MTDNRLQRCDEVPLCKHVEKALVTNLLQALVSLGVKPGSGETTGVESVWILGTWALE